jgi:hypothetical protein
MTAKINQCRDCQPKDQWIEIRLVDEMNQPFGSLSGKLKDSSGVEHQETLSGGYLLLTDLPGLTHQCLYFEQPHTFEQILFIQTAEPALVGHAQIT